MPAFGLYDLLHPARHAEDEILDDVLRDSLPFFAESTCKLSETGRRRIAVSYSPSHFIPQMFNGI